MKGKNRVDKFSQQLYNKDWEHLIQPQARYRAFALALDEAETEIEVLKSKLPNQPNETNKNRRS